jgi:hypothetical protein
MFSPDQKFSGIFAFSSRRTKIETAGKSSVFNNFRALQKLTKILLTGLRGYEILELPVWNPTVGTKTGEKRQYEPRSANPASTKSHEGAERIKPLG